MLEGLILRGLISNATFSLEFLQASKDCLTDLVCVILTEPDMKCLHEACFFLGVGFFFVVPYLKKKKKSFGEF